MIILIIESGETTSPEKLRESHPHVMFDYNDDEFLLPALAENGLAKVNMPDQPVFDSRLQCIEPINIVETDGVYSGDWSEPQMIEGVSRELIEQLIAEKRWMEEVNGVVSVAGKRFPTDEKTQVKVSAIYFRAKGDPELTVPSFESMDGFVALSNADIIELGDKIYGHVQASFARKDEMLKTEGATHLDW